MRSDPRATDNPHFQGSDPKRSEAAQYLASTLPDLAEIAGRHGFQTLRHLLDMAAIEAGEVMRMQKARLR